MQQAGFVVPKFGLETLGLKNLGNVHWNLSVPALYEEAIRRGEGAVADGGALRGAHRRAYRPLAQRQVLRRGFGQTKGRIDWGKTNKPISPERYRALYNRMLAYAQRRDLFVRDCWAGADPAHRIGVRVITETAWHNLFARNMFLRPPARGARGLQARLHHPEPAGLPGRSEARRHGVGLRHPGEFHRPRRGDLRHLVRRRDQEVGVHHPELPAARQERAADARLGQCRAEGRRGDLLRPVRHRQDDAVGRSVAHPDRRRRARLGRDQPLQLRGRLLRQGDQAVAARPSPRSTPPPSASARCWRTS